MTVQGVSEELVGILERLTAYRSRRAEFAQRTACRYLAVKSTDENFETLALTLVLRPEPTILSMEDLAQLGEGFTVVDSKSGEPEYVVAYGEVQSGTGSVIDVATAIRKLGEVWEFSTSLGEIPHSELSLAATARLNHKFRGKFVTFDNPETRASVDLVYDTQIPADSLTREEAAAELQNHAAVAVCTEPIVYAIGAYSQRLPDVDHSVALRIGQELVESNLQLQQMSRHPKVAYRSK